MIKSKSAASADAPPQVVDEAGSAAAGTRVAARWLASALGAIPSLAIIAAIVRAPGDAGFDETKLALGVAVAALGALTGVLAFSRVLAPIPLEDRDLDDFDLRRVPGQPFNTFEELQRDMDLLRSAAADQEWKAADALRAAKHAEAEADELVAQATEAEAAAALNPGDTALAERARTARKAAAAKESEAAAKSARSAATAAAQTTWNEQFSRREAIRQDVYRLKAADKVGERFFVARLATVFAVGLIATGFVLIGLAPKPKQTDATAAPRLVTLTLNDKGRRALGCSVTSLPALQTGGTKAMPTVVTLPVEGCPPKTVQFTTEQPDALGTVTAAMTVRHG